MENLLEKVAGMLGGLWDWTVHLNGGLQIVLVLLAVVMSGVCAIVAKRMQSPMMDMGGSVAGRTAVSIAADVFGVVFLIVALFGVAAVFAPLLFGNNMLVMLLREVAKAYVTHKYGQMGSVAPFTGSASPDTLFYNLFFMHSFGLTTHPSWNGTSWSIGAEFFTYLVFALVCLARPRWSLVLSIAIPVCAATGIALYSPHLINSDYDFGFVRCLYGFFTGVVLHQIFHRKPIRTFRKSPGFTLLECVILGVVAAYIIVSYDNFGMMAAPLIFAPAIYVFAHEKGAVSRLLRTAPFQALGKWSYSIYMVHWFIALSVTGVGKALEHRLHIPLSQMENGAPSLYLYSKPLTDLVVPAYLAVVVAVASLTYRFIEEPGRDYFNNLARRIRRRPQTARA